MKNNKDVSDTRITVHGHNAAPNDDCISPFLPRVLSIATNSSGGKNLYWNFRFAPEGTSVQWSWGPHGKGRAEGGCLGKDLLEKLTGFVNQISKNDSTLDFGSIGRCIPIQTCESHKIELLLSHHIGNVALRRWSHIGSTRYVAWQALQAAPWVVCTWGRHYWSGAATSPNYPNLCFHGWWGSKIQWHFGGVVLNISTNLAIVLRGRASGVSCGKSPWAWISHRAGCKRRWSF